MQQPRLEVKNFGPIKEADVTFGDLSIIVGPQATGKSIFLQLLKLLLDSQKIIQTLHEYNLFPKGDLPRFLDIYFGEGMASLFNASTVVNWNGDKKDLSLLMNMEDRKYPGLEAFLIPAQRVLVLRDGLTHTFREYRIGDPFSVREFSDYLHSIVQSHRINDTFFPIPNHLREEYREQITKNIFSEYSLARDTQLEKRLILKTNGQAGLPYLVWSTGQREFVPLLLGLDWLISDPDEKSRRFNWVMIEEPEMGLHPSAISTTMLLVMELLSRGYRVCLTTHSPHVLDIAWALQVFREKQGTQEDFLKIFELPSNPATKKLAASILQKNVSVHYFTRGGLVKDISSLNPGSDENDEAGWGGLSEFSGRIGDIVADVVTRHEFGSAAK